MNIFYLDKDPKICASYHCDQHVVKMILEYAQLLSEAHHVLGAHPLAKNYLTKSGWRSHPCAKWARSNMYHYDYLHELFCGVLEEYRARYNKNHVYEARMHGLKHAPPVIDSAVFSSPPLAMFSEFKDSHVDSDDPLDTTVEKYRLYYHSKTFARWKNGNIPPWFNDAKYLNELKRIKFEIIVS